MTTKQSRYLQRKQAKGFKQVTFLLPGSAIDELDRRVTDQQSSRLEVVKRWLLGESEIIEK